MQYTLGMAKELIAPSFGAGAYGVSDPAVAINKAIRALAAMSGWKCLRRTVRFTAVAPEFSLPQGCDGLVRVCVNGHPASVRDRGFTFLSSGIGAVPPPGYVEIPVRNVVDEGTFPTQDRIARPLYLAFATASPGTSKVRAGLELADGTPDWATLDMCSVHSLYGEAESEGDSGAPVFTPFPVARLSFVSFPSRPPSYVFLYGSPTPEPDPLQLRLLATYHPDVAAPSFRWYRLPGLPPGAPADILAETRIDPLPLVDDADVVPFSTIEPIEWMIRSDWESRSGEVDRAQKYRDMAAAWLTQQETVDETVQEPVIVNSIYDGSPGEISADSWNI